MEKPEGLSKYARLFDETCAPWNKNAEFNKHFLQAQQNYFNHKLRIDGYVFLNDVYQVLNFTRTSEGQIVGWWLDNDEDDHYIDFATYMNPEFISEMDPNCWLDFNVDGVIYDKLPDQ